MSKCLKVEYVIVQAEHIALALIVNDAGMVATGTYGMVHNMTFVLPGTLGAVTHGIAYALGAAGRCKRHVVVTVMFPEPWSLLVILDLGMLRYGTVK